MLRRDISPIKIKDITKDFLGDGNYEIRKVAGLNSADENCISFYKGDEVDFLKNVECGALIVKNSLRQQLENIQFKSRALIFYDYPMAFFTNFVNQRFNNDFTDQPVSLSNVSNTRVSKFAYIEKDVNIAEGCNIYPNVSVYRDTTIGANCTIQSGTVVGGVGMSYVQDRDNKYTRLTHLGNVIIGSNVDIGCNTTVLRGILESTIIKDGAKIGNHVNVGHNSVIGENTYISAGAVVGGATIIGENCWIAPGASIRDNIKIGKNCTIGVGSVVVKDTQPDSVYIGNPAKLFKKK